MVSVRAAKSKGSQFEYDVQYSLQQWTSKPVTRTAERGFQRQYDIAVGDVDNPIIVVECKRLKGISWNQLVKFYEKLCKVSAKSVNHICFKSNFQPCLVFSKLHGQYSIKQFEDTFFGSTFIKHPSTRAKKD